MSSTQHIIINVACFLLGVVVGIILSWLYVKYVKNPVDEEQKGGKSWDEINRFMDPDEIDFINQ